MQSSMIHLHLNLTSMLGHLHTYLFSINKALTPLLFIKITDTRKQPSLNHFVESWQSTASLLYTCTAGLSVFTGQSQDRGSKGYLGTQ